MPNENDLSCHREKLRESISDMSATIYNDFKNNDKFIRDVANALYKDSNDDGVKFIKVITDIQKFCIQNHRSICLLNFLINSMEETKMEKKKPKIFVKDIILIVAFVFYVPITVFILYKWML